MNNDNPRIFLCDPNLKGGAGHYLPYAETLGRAARELCVDLMIAAHVDARNVSSEFHVCPTFEKDYWSEMRAPEGLDPFVNLAREATRFGFNLRSLINEQRVSENDVLFFPYANLVEAMALASLMEANYKAYPRTVLLFRRDVDEQGHDSGVGFRSGRALLRIALARLVSADKGKRVRFFTDSVNLSEDYVEVSQLIFQTAPIPVDKSVAAMVKARNVFGRRPITLVYLGDARREKGYQLLPAVAERLRMQLADGSVAMILQSNFNIPDGEPGIADARKIMEDFPGICLLKSGLAQSEYLETLHAADLALLPYNSELYVSRTSGVLAEAICAGIPAVVPRNTWLSEQVSKSGSGVTFDYFNSMSFVDAVVEALERIQELGKRACERSDRYRSFHNPTRLVQFVAGAAIIDRASRGASQL